MKTISFTQAQRSYDHMEEPVGKYDWAYDAVLSGLENNFKAMLEYLDVTEQEFIEEYDNNRETLADAKYIFYAQKFESGLKNGY